MYKRALLSFSPLRKTDKVAGLFISRLEIPMHFNVSAITKYLTVVLVISMLTGRLGAQENSFDDAIKHASTHGVFRLGFINVDPDVAGNPTTYATAVGGQLKFETAPWQRLQFAIAPYFSQKVGFLSGDEDTGKLNGDFFDSNNDSFAYLGEAYVHYAWSNGTARLGRQQLDTPFINIDDIRMAPNTFEAFWLNGDISANLHLQGGLVKRWAGFGSGGDQHTFKDASNDGVLAAGAIYKMRQHHTFQVWYYDFDDNYQQAYADAIYSNGNFEAGIQYTTFNENNASGTDGTAWGVKVGYAFDWAQLSAAYNKSSNDPGKSVSNGLGGGNFFTSLDETSIDGVSDATAYVLAIDYPISKAVTLGVALGHFEDRNGTTHDLDELNLILASQATQNLSVDFVYTTVDNDADPADAGSNFDRILIFANYLF
jgi:imipenem/basic amino acid-specific outer membrane pore